MRGPVTLDVERAQARLDALEARSAALATLAAKLREIERDERYKAVWELAILRGAPYAGPTWEKELLAAEAALGKKDPIRKGASS